MPDLASVIYAENILGQWTDLTSLVVSQLQVIDWYPFLRPFIRFVPASLSTLKQQLDRIGYLENTLFFELLDRAQKAIADGKVYPSKKTCCSRLIGVCEMKSLTRLAGFTRDMLTMTEKDGQKVGEKQIAYNAGHALAAATYVLSMA